jgi:hypothetical protein
MRILVSVGALVIIGCDSPIRQVAPGSATLNGDDDDTDDQTGMGGLYHCDQVGTLGQCREYTGAAWSESAATSNCGAPVTIGNCARTALLGGCVVSGGSELQYTRWYYDGDFYTADDAEFLEADCLNNGGQWIGGGGDM